jgi:hypothetical protein
MNRKRKYMVVYGLLYLDQRESIEYAEMQIAKLVADCPALVEQIAVVFDLVATRRQVRTGFAHELAGRILEYIDEHYPTIGLRVVGVTDSDLLRPGRDRMMRGSWRVDNVHQYLILGDEYDVYPHSEKE